MTKKLPLREHKRIKRILDIAARGHNIHRLHREEASKPIYCIGSTELTTKTFQDMADAGIIQPAQDGLFDGFSQTWIVT